MPVTRRSVESRLLTGNRVITMVGIIMVAIIAVGIVVGIMAVGIITTVDITGETATIIAITKITGSKPNELVNSDSFGKFTNLRYD